jgi:hypothetical protein
LDNNAVGRLNVGAITGAEEEELSVNHNNDKAAEPKNKPLITVNRGLSLKAERGRELKQTADGQANADSSSI